VNKKLRKKLLLVFDDSKIDKNRFVGIEIKTARPVYESADDLIA